MSQLAPQHSANALQRWVLPPVAEHLAIAKTFNRLDQVGPEYMWWHTEVGITSRPQRKVEPEPLDVQA
ncbi:MAG: hypothetical protein ABIQ39_08445 [Ilumatobacteraceae bacterium]